MSKWTLFMLSSTALGENIIGAQSNNWSLPFSIPSPSSLLHVCSFSFFYTLNLLNMTVTLTYHGLFPLDGLHGDGGLAIEDAFCLKPCPNFIVDVCFLILQEIFGDLAMFDHHLIMVFWLFFDVVFMTTAIVCAWHDNIDLSYPLPEGVESHIWTQLRKVGIRGIPWASNSVRN